MVASLTPAQLEFARHYFQYHDSTDHYLSKLSIAEIQNIAQCGLPLFIG